MGGGGRSEADEGPVTSFTSTQQHTHTHTHTHMIKKKRGPVIYDACKLTDSHMGTFRCHFTLKPPGPEHSFTVLMRQRSLSARSRALSLGLKGSTLVVESSRGHRRLVLKEIQHTRAILPW